MTRDPVTVTAAENIKALMEARGIDAAKLSRLAGLNPTGIYDILSGKSQSPKLVTIARIAQALEVPLASIFETEKEAGLRTDLLAILEALPDDRRRLLLRTARAWQDDPS